MKKKTKILYLVTEDWYFCSHRLPIARAAYVSGMDVVVATRVGKYGKIIEDEGFKLVPLSMRRRGKNPIREIFNIIEIFRLYRSECPDIVHHVAMKPVIYGSIAAKMVSVKGVVNALTGMGFVFTTKNWLAQILKPVFLFSFRYLLTDKNSSAIIQNMDDKKLIQTLCQNKNPNIALIRGSGVDIDLYHSTPEPDTIIISVTLVSRILRDKGILEFIEAVRLLKNRGVQLRAVLVGMPDPDNPSSISEGTISTWVNEGLIEWSGYQTDIQKIWNGSHIAVLPSYREGLPKSLLEAAACGRPIITTDVPGCREIVEDGVNGIIVEPRNSSQLAEAILVLISNCSLRKKMGDRSRTIVEDEFSVGKVVSETLKLYNHILKDKGFL